MGPDHSHAAASLAQCAHCNGVIKRNGTRWVHTDSGRKSCSVASVHQAQPRRRAI